jgi:hypothetical protein
MRVMRTPPMISSGLIWMRIGLTGDRATSVSDNSANLLRQSCRYSSASGSCVRSCFADDCNTQFFHRIEENSLRALAILLRSVSWERIIAHLISKRHALLARHRAQNLILPSSRLRTRVRHRHHDENVSTERNYARAAVNHACRGDRRAVGLGIALLPCASYRSPALPGRLRLHPG